MAFCTARSDAQTRFAMVAIEGQQTPWSLALSAREISTAFWAMLIPSSGQHWDMMMVLMP
jgi:hypothetical protein